MTLTVNSGTSGGYHVVRSLSAMSMWIKYDFLTLSIHPLCDLSKCNTMSRILDLLLYGWTLRAVRDCQNHCEISDKAEQFDTFLSKSLQWPEDLLLTIRSQDGFHIEIGIVSKTGKYLKVGSFHGILNVHPSNPALTIKQNCKTFSTKLNFLGGGYDGFYAGNSRGRLRMILEAIIGVGNFLIFSFQLIFLLNVGLFTSGDVRRNLQTVRSALATEIPLEILFSKKWYNGKQIFKSFWKHVEQYYYFMALFQEK